MEYLVTTASQRWCVLLRGINVGGKNKVKMADLRVCLEDLGFGDVRTYIQSGNVVLTTAEPVGAEQLAGAVSSQLQRTFALQIPVAAISAEQLTSIVSEAPAGFGSDPERYRDDVLFVLPPVTPGEVLAQLSPKPGVDEAQAGTHAVYFRRLSERAAQSRLSRIVQLPVYQSVTIRNWRTTATMALMVAQE